MAPPVKPTILAKDDRSPELRAAMEDVALAMKALPTHMYVLLVVDPITTGVHFYSNTMDMTDITQLCSAIAKRGTN